MLQNYDVKILLALQKALEGRKDFFKWLLENGYPELAAFSNAVRGDEDALKWLFDHKQFAVLGVLSDAIDNDSTAVEWLQKYNDPFLIYFSKACRRDQISMKWLRENELDVYILLSQTIHDILKLQEKDNLFWYRMNFRRKK